MLGPSLLCVTAFGSPGQGSWVTLEFTVWGNHRRHARVPKVGSLQYCIWLYVYLQKLRYTLDLSDCDCQFYLLEKSKVGNIALGFIVA